MAASKPLVELRQVTQTYGTPPQAFTAIRHIDLFLAEGEFVALLGPSGCGKSTLVRIITGLQRPSTGEVRYRGELLRGVNPHASIVFQHLRCFPG